MIIDGRIFLAVGGRIVIDYLLGNGVTKYLSVAEKTTSIITFKLRGERIERINFV